MKFIKILAFLLSLLILVSVVSCGKEDEKPLTTTAGSNVITTNGVEGDPVIAPETPAFGDAIDDLIAKGYNLNIKVENIRDKGYTIVNEAETASLFDLDNTTGLKAKLVDGNYLQLKTSLKSKIAGYIIYSGATAPTGWTVKASTDSSKWVDIDVVGQSNAVENAGSGYEIDADKQGEYSYYRFVFNDKEIDINEIVLIGTDEEKPDTDPDVISAYYNDGKLVTGNIVSVALDGITFDGDAKEALFTDPDTTFKATASDGATITVTFDHTIGTNSYIVKAKNANLVSYIIYASENGKTWTPIDVVCDARMSEGPNGYDMDRHGVAQKYLKIVICKTSGEIELDSIELIGERINIALGKTVTATTVYADDPFYAPGQMVDGNMADTRWNSKGMIKTSGSNGTWPGVDEIVIDFGGNYRIESIEMRWNIGNRAGQQVISVSKDGVDYTEITTINGLPDEFQKYTFENVEGRYIKYAFYLAESENYGYSIWEIEAYGDEIFDSSEND